MIDWTNFKKLIGNKKRKYVKGTKGTYHFVSYNAELKEITLMHIRAIRTLTVFQLDHFIKAFDYIGMTDYKPLF